MLFCNNFSIPFVLSLQDGYFKEFMGILIQLQILAHYWYQSPKNWFTKLFCNILFKLVFISAVPKPHCTAILCQYYKCWHNWEYKYIQLRLWIYNEYSPETIPPHFPGSHSNIVITMSVPITTSLIVRTHTVWNVGPGAQIMFLCPKLPSHLTLPEWAAGFFVPWAHSRGEECGKFVCLDPNNSEVRDFGISDVYAIMVA